MSLNDAKPYEWDQAARRWRAGKGTKPPIEFATPDLGEDVKPVTKAGKDMVKNPEHYKTGEIECIDAIRASLTTEEYRGYLKGNIIKYTWRYPYKNGVEDLRKQTVYTDWLIKSLCGLS